MFRFFAIVLFSAFALSSAAAEYVYKDGTGRVLHLYYSWAVDASGATRLNVQLVNYSNVTWVDIVLNCDVANALGTRVGTKEIPLDVAVFDFELTKDINDINIGQIQPRAKLNCSIVKAAHGEKTLKRAQR